MWGQWVYIILIQQKFGPDSFWNLYLRYMLFCTQFSPTPPFDICWHMKFAFTPYLKSAVHVRLEFIQNLKGVFCGWAALTAHVSAKFLKCLLIKAAQRNGLSVMQSENDPGTYMSASQAILCSLRYINLQKSICSDDIGHTPLLKDSGRSNRISKGT